MELPTAVSGILRRSPESRRNSQLLVYEEVSNLLVYGISVRHDSISEVLVFEITESSANSSCIIR